MIETEAVLGCGMVPRHGHGKDRIGLIRSAVGERFRDGQVFVRRRYVERDDSSFVVEVRLSGTVSYIQKSRRKKRLADKWMVLDVNDAEQDRVVNGWFAFASPAKRYSKQRCRVMEMNPVHLGADHVGQAVVRWRVLIDGSQGQAVDVFVNSLGYERDVEVQFVSLAEER